MITAPKERNLLEKAAFPGYSTFYNNNQSDDKLSNEIYGDV